VLLAGCGTTTKTGRLGETLADGGIQVVVDRLDPTPPIPRHDITGLSTPARGNHLLGVDVRVCSKTGAAIGPYDFAVDVSGSGRAQLKFPQRIYSESFETIRATCARGWIVFESPSGSTAQRIRFRFDDTGQSGQGGGSQGGRPESHQRFSWTIE
jgi:hypothetical protein